MNTQYNIPASAAPVEPAAQGGHQSRAGTPPRKVLLATAMARFSGSFEERVALLAKLLDQADDMAREKYSGRSLDLLILPEVAFSTGKGGTAADAALPLERLAANVGPLAAKHGTYVIAPAVLADEKPTRTSNAAVIFDRTGKVAGIYRKYFLVAASPGGPLENGASPGRKFPVFDCDFGKLGIQICWDMSYVDGWDALAAGGAEIVALPTFSPQTVRPSAHALRGHYYVVNSTPRDNVTVFSPIGTVLAQRTEPGILLHEIDLSYAILHWSFELDNGKSLSRAYGDRAGFQYLDREDTGIFWSNDPAKPIGAMLKELNFHEMQEYIDWSRRLREQNNPKGK
jgi:predicted amidohydrolase